MTGSSRRCGGQGDVLSGAVGTFLAWGKNYEEREAKDEECVLAGFWYPRVWHVVDRRPHL